MPYLRPEERMQKCIAPFHKEHRSQEYYIVRKYYSPVENHICQGCLKVIETTIGSVFYTVDDGYQILDIKTLKSVVPEYPTGGAN